MPKSWGGVTRRGTGQVFGGGGGGAAKGRLSDASPRGASEAWQQATSPDDRPNWEPEVWVQADDVRGSATGAVARGRKAPSKRADAPAPGRSRSNDRQAPPSGEPARRPRVRGIGRAVADELAKTAGPTTAPKLAQRLADASRAYERERYDEARKLLRPLAERAPGAAAVRELLGLTLYRMGQWRNAIKELEAFRLLTNSTEQHPVLADCYRALGRPNEVEELWEELRTVSPSAELVAEGRIVVAGMYADRGDLDQASKLLEQGLRNAKRLREHHLRVLYALADVVERSGDIPQARTLFQRVAAADANFADVGMRLRSLG